MRILVITGRRSLEGGIEIYIKNIISILKNIGHEVALLYEVDGLDGVSHVDDYSPYPLVWCVGAKQKGLKLALSWKPDICYSQGMISANIEQEIALRVPTIFFSHAYVGACISGSKSTWFPAPKPCNRKLSFVCLALYMPLRCGGLNPRTMLNMYRNQRFRQVLLSRYRGVCVATHHMQSVMLKNGVCDDNLHILPLFPNHQDPDPEPPLARPHTGIILLAGRLTRLKGWTHLVPAISMASAKLGRIHTLAIAGDGPDRIKLLNLAARYHVPVEWYGWLSPEDISAKMRQADLLAVPSLWPEPFGLVGIEAGCVGTPAVAYAVGGIPDWLIPGVSGEMAPAERLHPAPLADAIVRALRDTNHWQKLREGAWRQATMFSRERHVAKLMQILQSAASG